jgi:hypothetical protein
MFVFVFRGLFITSTYLSKLIYVCILGMYLGIFQLLLFVFFF